MRAARPSLLTSDVLDGTPTRLFGYQFSDDLPGALLTTLQVIFSIRTARPTRISSRASMHLSLSSQKYSSDPKSALRITSILTYALSFTPCPESFSPLCGDIVQYLPSTERSSKAVTGLFQVISSQPASLRFDVWQRLHSYADSLGSLDGIALAKIYFLLTPIEDRLSKPAVLERLTGETLSKWTIQLRKIRSEQAERALDLITTLQETTSAPKRQRDNCDDLGARRLIRERMPELKIEMDRGLIESIGASIPQ